MQATTFEKKHAIHSPVLDQASIVRRSEGFNDFVPIGGEGATATLSALKDDTKPQAPLKDSALKVRPSTATPILKSFAPLGIDLLTFFAEICLTLHVLTPRQTPVVQTRNRGLQGIRCSF